MGAEGIFEKLEKFGECLLNDTSKIGDCFDNNEISIDLKGFEEIDSIDLFEKNKKMFDFMINTLLKEPNNLNTDFEKILEKHIRAYLDTKGIELDKNLEIIDITKDYIKLDKSNIKSYNGKKIDSINEDIIIRFGKKDNIESENDKNIFYSNNYSGTDYFNKLNNGNKLHIKIDGKEFVLKNEDGYSFEKNGSNITTFIKRVSLDKGFSKIFSNEIGTIYFSKFKGGRMIFKNLKNEIFDIDTGKKIELESLIKSLSYDELFNNEDNFNFFISIYNLDFFEGKILDDFKSKLKLYLNKKGIKLNKNFKLSACFGKNEYFHIMYKDLLTPDDTVGGISIFNGNINYQKSPENIEGVKKILKKGQGKNYEILTEHEKEIIKVLLENEVIIDYGIVTFREIGRLEYPKEEIRKFIDKLKNEKKRKIRTSDLYEK